MKKAIQFLTLSLVFFCFDATAFEFTTAEIVGNAVKEKISRATADDFYELMEQHYTKLGLLDEDGNWAIAKMGEQSDFLLPELLTVDDIYSFIDDIVDSVNNNPYMLNFIENANIEDYAVLMQKFESEGSRILPDVVAYAEVLERLTKVLYEDHTLLEDLVQHFQELKARIKISKYFSFFENAKLISVEIPIKNYRKYFEDSNVPRVNPRITLPLNIMEATLVDFFAGRNDNAYAGWVLAEHKSGNKYDPNTGADIPRISSDGKAVEYNMPFPKNWADLYATWNMAFVSTYKDFPYFYTKLLIPQVNNYSEKPNQYIYNRAIALYVHIHHVGVTRKELQDAGFESINWLDENLIRDWGKYNRMSATEYQYLF